MRFFLKLNLNQKAVVNCDLDVSVFNGILDAGQEMKGNNYYFLNLRYQNPYPAISEYFYDHPIYENERYLILIAGSLYNRQQSQKNSQAIPQWEDLLHILAADKVALYQRFKGNYYIFVFDKTQYKATIYSSPMFLTPAYIYHEGETLYFSNHLDFIIDQMKRPELNNRAMIEFTLFDHTIHNTTPIKDVFLIPGGYEVTLSKAHKLKFTLAYDIANWLSRDLYSRRDSLERIDTILHDVLEKYINSSPRFNLSLTGGFDGRLNLAFINNSDYSKMKAFSYGMPGSNQISIPSHIAQKLSFKYEPVFLGSDFSDSYADWGLRSIFLTSGVTGFNRAVYPYAYKLIGEFSKSCILGQCDMIRPLYNNPAGSIFNIFSKTLLLDENYEEFYIAYNRLREKSFIHQDFFTESDARNIYNSIYNLYIKPYPQFTNKERFYFYLYKESIMKYWHTECHLVNLFLDDFIPFSDLDYIEELHRSPYCGLYKGILAGNQLQRRNAHDLYVELTTINNPRLNNFFNDRYFKPRWLKYGLVGFAISGVGKKIAKARNRLLGNDTFDEVKWPQLFYEKYADLINQQNKAFLINNVLGCHSYDDNNEYRKERHLSLKIWMDAYKL